MFGSNSDGDCDDLRPVDVQRPRGVAMTEGAYKPFSRPAQWIEEAAALQARIAELETENLALISRIVETDCRDYGRDEYQTQSLADQVLIDRLVAAGRMRHKCNDHKGRPIYEFVHASSEGGP